MRYLRRLPRSLVQRSQSLCLPRQLLAGLLHAQLSLMPPAHSLRGLFRTGQGWAPWAALLRCAGPRRCFFLLSPLSGPYWAGLVGIVHRFVLCDCRRTPCHLYVCAKSLQSCPALCGPVNCRPAGSSVRGVSQARMLEWVAMPSSRASSRPRDPPCFPGISCTGSWIRCHQRHLLLLKYCYWILALIS